ncbi:MAG TPA: YajG family lipoprotein [Candidatus Binataceae bacterium]|nr:YajG family lipoprotein [Candidatus Binataceae bacterium]
MPRRITIMILAAVMGAACAAVSSNPITLEYTAPDFLNPAQGAEGVTLRVVVYDARADRSSLGNLQDSTGAVIGPITTTSSVTDTIAQAAASGLATRGFNVTATGPVIVRIDLARFDNQFEATTLGRSASARMVINVQVIGAGGKQIYAKTYSADGHNANFQSASGDNAKPALDRALSGAVNVLVTDPDFIAALERAARA